MYHHSMTVPAVFSSNFVDRTEKKRRAKISSPDFRFPLCGFSPFLDPAINRESVPVFMSFGSGITTVSPWRK